MESRSTNTELPLTPGTKILTRVFSVIPLDPTRTISGFETIPIPRRFTGTFRNQKRRASQMVIRQKRTDFEFPELSPPASGLQLQGQWAEGYCIQNSILLVEYTCVWLTGQKEAWLSSESVYRHWAAFYPKYDLVEDRVLAESGLEHSHSDWQFPMTVVIPGEASLENVDQIKRVFTRAVSPKNQDSVAFVETTDLTGAVTWDGSIFYMHNSSEEALDAVAFLMRIACADWRSHEQAMSQALEALAVDEHTFALMQSARAMVRDFYRAMALFDPFRLSYQESDIEFIKAIDRGWGRTDFHQRTEELLGRIHTLYGLSVDEKRDKEALVSAKRQNILNQYVSWLAIMAVTSTVAGVITSIDFSNRILHEIG